MFVCMCHAVSDRTIIDSIERGASTVAEVGRACHAGTGCGACRVRIRHTLAQHRSSGSPTCTIVQGQGNLVEARHHTAPTEIIGRLIGRLHSPGASS